MNNDSSVSGVNHVEGIENNLDTSNNSNDIEINASLYDDEVYTINYLNGIFSSLQNISLNINTLIRNARTHLDEENAIGENVSAPDFADLSIIGNEELFNKGIVTTNGGNLNIRSSPGGEVISTAANGEELQIVGVNPDNPEWTEVRLKDGKSAYVSSRYINNKNAVTFYPNNEGKVNITSGHLNVRSSPNGPIISQLEKDDIVTVIGRAENNSNWTKVKLESGQEAYVYSQYLEGLK